MIFAMIRCERARRCRLPLRDDIIAIRHTLPAASCAASFIPRERA